MNNHFPYFVNGIHYTPFQGKMGKNFEIFEKKVKQLILADER